MGHSEMYPYLPPLLVLVVMSLVSGQDPTCQDTASLTVSSWHLHYVFNDTTAAVADTFTARFVEQFRAYFPEDTHCPFGPNYGGPNYHYICFLGGGSGPNGGAHGPWNDAEWGFFVPPQFVSETLGWAVIHRSELSLMFHINTGCMADDHTARAMWVGDRKIMFPAQLPCNTPDTGCYMRDPNCGCDLPLPGGVLDTCDNCVPNGGDGKY